MCFNKNKKKLSFAETSEASSSNNESRSMCSVFTIEQNTLFMMPEDSSKRFNNCALS